MQANFCITKRGSMLCIPVQAKPNARFSQVTDVNSECISIQIAAPPHDGEANKELCTFLAGVLPGVKKRDVNVRPGTQKSRFKIVEVQTDLDPAQALEALQKAR